MSAPSPQARRERSEKEAALWAARLESGSLPPPWQEELERWFECDPDHRWLLGRYRELNARLGQQVPVLLDAADVGAVVDRAAGWQRLRRRAGPALALAAAVCVAALIWQRQPERMATESGERRTVALGDGSRVELNAETKLEVAFRDQERRVFLRQGEALFQVSPDATRPFLVVTRTGSVVRVTGTSFNVRENARGVQVVTVLEGTVQVQPSAENAQPVPVFSHQEASIGASAVEVRSVNAEEAQASIAWRVGQVAFHGVRLDDALRCFGSYHHRQVAVDESASTYQVGGRFSLDDLDGFLAAIEEALPVVVLRRADGSARVVARQPPAAAN